MFSQRNLILGFYIFSFINLLSSEGHIIPWTRTSELLKKEMIYCFKNNKHQISYKKAINSNDELFKQEEPLALKGGGPLLGAIGYWFVKGFGYGVPVAVASGAIIAAAPAVATTLGGVGVGTATSFATGATALGAEVGMATTSIATSVTALGGSSLASGVVATVGTTTSANTLATVGLSATSVGTSYLAMVETASIAISALLTALPTP